MTKVYQEISRWSRGIVRVLGKNDRRSGAIAILFESLRAKSFVRKRESNRERSYIDRKWRARTSAEQGFFLVKAKKKSSLGIGLAILTALKEAERN